MLRSAVYGATLPLRSLRLVLSRPKLLFWSAFPLALTLVLYVWLMRRFETWVGAEITAGLALLHLRPDGFFAGVISFFATVLAFLFGAITFSIGASLVASPFNDRLAEIAEHCGEPPLPPAPRARGAGRLRLLAIDGVKSLCVIVAGVAFVLVSWVPGLNLLALVALCFLVTFQYISYPQTRRGQGVGHGLVFLVRHPWSSLAFGGVMSVLLAIPFLSCLAVPLAVVGGTLLVARAQKGSAFTLR